jgi:hypothetical protein
MLQVLLLLLCLPIDPALALADVSLHSCAPSYSVPEAP